jgi:hypothetical protein
MPYKRKSNGRVKYTAQIIHQGRRYQKLCKTRREAVDWEAEKRKELESPVPSSVPLKFHILCEAYLTYSQPRLSTKTYDEKEKLLAHMVERWGDVPLEQITPSRVANYLPQRSKKLSNNGSNQDRKNLHSVFTWGHKFLRVDSSPVATIPPLPHKPRQLYTPCREDVLKVMAVATRAEKVFLSGHSAHER